MRAFCLAAVASVAVAPDSPSYGDLFDQIFAIPSQADDSSSASPIAGSPAVIPSEPLPSVGASSAAHDGVFDDGFFNDGVFNDGFFRGLTAGDVTGSRESSSSSLFDSPHSRGRSNSDDSLDFSFGFGDFSTSYKRPRTGTRPTSSYPPSPLRRGYSANSVLRI